MAESNVAVARAARRPSNRSGITTGLLATAHTEASGVSARRIPRSPEHWPTAQATSGAAAGHHLVAATRSGTPTVERGDGPLALPAQDVQASLHRRSSSEAVVAWVFAGHAPWRGVGSTVAFSPGRCQRDFDYRSHSHRLWPTWILL
ncbi:hypothetical protein BN12_240043 [Nostocoides japonicum T1-X7]|uniref:Uncharacterized protein n=1 Tax=Nostocoides japonicum T1-X7 TaxID=1194083 RepID=A0A077M183_9MICO|nr:hypothetical protein BN12_240043 [Tetrasphaera japonica T1-X7]